MPSEPYKFSYKASNQENLSLGVYNTGYQKCEPSYSWGPGTRDHYLFHFVTEGRGHLETNGQVLEIERGGLFLIRPNEVVVYTADQDDPWEYYWVGFNGTEARRLIHLTMFAHGERLLYPENPEEIRSRLIQIYQSRGSTPEAETRMLGGLYLFLSMLMEAASAEQQTTAKQYVDHAVRYISRNYSREIGVPDIADAVGVSASHLYRLFSKELYISPVAFLIQYRINEACSLLHNSSLSVREIALSVGFSDPLYFSRVFRRIKGVPPSKYQQSVEEI